MDDEVRAGDDANPAVEQFQHAALEAVRAARAVLDAAEALIRDPSTLEPVIRTATDVARSATEAVAGFAASATGGDPHDHRPSAPEDPDDGGYEPIRVD